MHDGVHLLTAVSPFSDLPPAELAEVLRVVQRRTYRADEPVFREGDPPAFMYYVLYGEVTLTLTWHDRRISVGKFTEGRLLGIQTLFDDGPQFLSATALVPTSVLAIPRDALLAPFRRHPDAVFRMAAIFARQIRAAALAVAEMQFLDLQVRLAKRLTALSTEAGARRDAQGHLAVRVTQQELSELTGATRGGVNRVLKRLEHLGIIRTHRGMVTILIPERLGELTQHEPLPVILGLASSPT